MRVEQIVNNQFKIYTDEGVYFQSYDSVVAFKANDGGVILGEDYKYSRTTMKYLIQFLNVDSIKVVDKNVEDGVWKIDSELYCGSDKSKYIKTRINNILPINSEDVDFDELLSELQELALDL